MCSFGLLRMCLPHCPPLIPRTNEVDCVQPTAWLREEVVEPLGWALRTPKQTSRPSDGCNRRLSRELLGVMLLRGITQYRCVIAVALRRVRLEPDSSLSLAARVRPVCNDSARSCTTSKAAHRRHDTAGSAATHRRRADEGCGKLAAAGEPSSSLCFCAAASTVGHSAHACSH